MFRDIGDKIKNLAKYICCVGIIFSVIIAIILIVVGIEENLIFFIFLGLLVGVIGSFLSWIGVFLIYGFGELIDTTNKNNELLKIIAMSDSE